MTRVMLCKSCHREKTHADGCPVQPYDDGLTMALEHLQESGASNIALRKGIETLAAEATALRARLATQEAEIARLKAALGSAQKHIPACFGLGGGMNLTCRARNKDNRMWWCVACVLDDKIDAALKEPA